MGVIRSKIVIGQGSNLITIFNSQHFNWFQKKMLKLCFGFTVTDYKEKVNSLNSQLL